VSEQVKRKSYKLHDVHCLLYCYKKKKKKRKLYTAWNKEGRQNVAAWQLLADQVSQGRVIPYIGTSSKEEEDYMEEPSFSQSQYKFRNRWHN
jgi:hypothetical protein